MPLPCHPERGEGSSEAAPRTDMTCFRRPTRACAGSSSLDRAHPARSYAPMKAFDHERAGCARSTDHDRARLRLGPAGRIQPAFGVAVRRLKQAGEAAPRTDKTCFRRPTRACAGSSSLDRAHPARSYAPMKAPDHERAGCARSTDHDRARLRLGPAGRIQPVFGVGNLTRLHAVRRHRQAGVNNTGLLWSGREVLRCARDDR